MTTVAIIGATGSTGRLTVDATLERGLKVRATNRSAHRAHRLLGERAGLEIIEADGTDLTAVTAIVDGADAVIEALRLLSDRRPHVSPMSAISVSQNIPAWAEVLE